MPILAAPTLPSVTLACFKRSAFSVAKPRQLAHPPLREALIDIQLTNSLPLSFADLLKDRVIPGYERKNEIRMGQFSFRIGTSVDTPISKREESAGWRYESPDGSRVIQLRRNGVTYSILKGYVDFPELKAAMQQVWNMYRQWIYGASDVTIGRVAARYINVLDFPPGTELDDFLSATPRVPEGLPQTLLHFLQRITVPFEHGITAIITQATEPSGHPSFRVILDIDVYAQRVFAADGVGVWDFLDRLREIKNSIFFSSVTERALEGCE